ncbi:MAG: FtsH protease activity modulator HflK [Chromatiales bacterium]|nr:FtsH protease activity modulator HflK [Chromatiales bacterium]
MAWNEPGGGDKKDPWTGNGDKGPPDLDEVVRKMQDRLGGLFGGRRRGGRSGGNGSGAPPAPGRNRAAIVIIALVLLVAWLWTGVYTVQPAERGVVYRFGAFNRITSPGLNFHAPVPIESHDRVDVDQVQTFTHKGLMLTQDENIVDLELAVQFVVRDPAEFLFNVRDPVSTLRDVTEAAVRAAIGKNKLDYILTEGRGPLKVEIQERIQTLSDRYRAGIQVTSVNTQPAKPPEEVKSAFDDAIKAREDKERLENEAHAYANEVVPRARGNAARISQDAQAYRERVVALAEGEADRFNKLREEYEKAPEVTRQRMYIDAMEYVLRNTNKVVVDVNKGNNLLYLPLDQISGGSGGQTADSDSRRGLPPLPPSLAAPSNSMSNSPDSTDRVRRPR